jgi:hypothetical protein
MSKLSINDPMSRETLTRIQELSETKSALCEQYFDMDAEKIRLTVAIKQIEQEKQRLFEKELVDRGMSPTAAVEVDGKTGVMTLLSPAGTQVTAAPIAPEPTSTPEK